MSKKLGILLKIFASKDYKEQFLDGKLYMNTIEYFRHFEEDVDGNVADKYEALTGWMHPNEFKFVIEINGEKHTLNSDNLAGPVTTSMCVHNNANVYCMTQLHSHDIDMSNIKSNEEYELVKEYFTLPKEVERLGPYMVIITNPVEFNRRVADEAKRLCKIGEANWFASRQVTYYDESSGSFILDDSRDAPFYKQSKYKHQNEYRICLIRNNEENEPFTMNIGSVRDIVIETETKDFNSIIELRKV